MLFRSHIAQKPREGLTVSELASALNISHTHILNRLNDMQELGIVQYQYPLVKRPGNQPHVYLFTKELQDVAKALGFSPDVANLRKLRTVTA